jgi:riboflavin synthase alpha subunit
VVRLRLAEREMTGELRRLERADRLVGDVEWHVVEGDVDRMGAVYGKNVK